VSPWEARAEAGDFDRYDPTYALERAEQKSAEHFERLAQKRALPLEIEDVKRIFGSVVDVNTSAVMREILSVCALWLWGAKPKLGQTWFRRDPKRAPFHSLAGAIFCATLPLRNELGASTGTTYNVAQAKGSLRATSLRGGVVACHPSRNGASSEVRGQQGIELRVDAQRAVAQAGIDDEDLALLRVAEAEKKGGAAKAAEALLRHRGLLVDDAPPSAVKAAVREVLPAIRKRLTRAGRRLERSLRAVAAKPPEGWEGEEVPLLRLREGLEPEEAAATADELAGEAQLAGRRTRPQIVALAPTLPLGLCA
jgi:hypothetical protein